MTTPYLQEDVLEGAQQTSSAPSDVSDAPQSTQGPLLDERDEKKVCDGIVALLHEDAANRKRRRAEWECNRLWQKGVRGARVRRSSEDRNAAELVVPLGAFDLPPVMDRADELLEKFVARLTADPALPDAEPATDASEDRDAAEFTTRLLTVEGSESGYNNQGVVRRALRKAGVYGSGFVYPCLDATGGGWRPMEIKAHPSAQHKDMALQMPAMDQQTGQPMMDEMGQPMLSPAPEETLVQRFVKRDGSLTDQANEADRQWMPKIRPEVLTGEQVVLLPQTCQSVADAQGVILIRWTPLGELKRKYAKRLGKVDADMAHKLVDWRPEDAKHAKPGFLSAKDLAGTTTDSGKVRDSALVCTLSLYYRSHGAYPKGAFITVAGGDMVLHKQAWAGMVETGTDLREEMLELPIAQFRQFDDDIDDDPYGFGLIRKIGPTDEVRGDIVMAWQEYLDKFLHPIPYVPLGSIVQPGQLQDRDDSPVYFNPQGKPEYEDIKPFPADGKEFFDRATDAQNSAALMEEAAQGVDTPTATSGVAKQIVVQQVHVAMATARSNTADGQERLWRIVAQLIRVFYTVPMKLKYQGDDGAYKEKEWSRTDLGSTKDVRIARGSFTQQSPEQKQAELDARFERQQIDQEEYDRLSASNIRARIGFQDNPHRMRVRKQLSAWRDGDPQAFADMRAVDDEQDVARIRWLEIRREMAGARYGKADQNLRAVFDQEYNRARQAAGITTLAEQQQAAMQQQADAAAQQQQAQGAELSQKSQSEAQKLDAQSQESAADRDFEREMQANQQTMDMERDAMQTQGALT